MYLVDVISFWTLEYHAPYNMVHIAIAILEPELPN